MSSLSPASAVSATRFQRDAPRGRLHHADRDPLLSVEHLSVSFMRYDPSASYFAALPVELQIIRDLSLSVCTGEIVAVVGASGAGKTLLADSILGLWEPNARVCGTIVFEGLRRDASDLVSMRGHGISLVPQSITNLDPLMRIGAQVIGAGVGRRERACRRRRMFELFDRYGLSAEIARCYPHELSGGMVRRVLLVCALMDDPRLIVADEPTPGLDERRARQSMADLRSFADDGGAVLLISHDLELAARTADRIAVFCEGTIVEQTACSNFASPDTLEHPFSRALWRALPEHGFYVGRPHAGGSVA